MNIFKLFKKKELIKENKIQFKTSIGEFYLGEEILVLNCFAYSDWDKSNYNPDNDNSLFNFVNHQWFNAKILQVSEDISIMEVQCFTKDEYYDTIGISRTGSVKRELNYNFKRWIKITDKNIKKILKCKDK